MPHLLISPCINRLCRRVECGSNLSETLLHKNLRHVFHTPVSQSPSIWFWYWQRDSEFFGLVDSSRLCERFGLPSRTLELWLYNFETPWAESRPLSTCLACIDVLHDYFYLLQYSFWQWYVSISHSVNHYIHQMWHS